MLELKVSKCLFVFVCRFVRRVLPLSQRLNRRLYMFFVVWTVCCGLDSFLICLDFFLFVV